MTKLVDESREWSLPNLTDISLTVMIDSRMKHGDGDIRISLNTEGVASPRWFMAKDLSKNGELLQWSRRERDVCYLEF